MSCNKFSNKCASGIGINYKNQSKFYLAPTAGFWGTMDGVFQNRTLDNLVQAKGAPNTTLTVGLLIEGNAYHGGEYKMGEVFDNMRKAIANLQEAAGSTVQVSDLCIRVGGIPRGPGYAGWGPYDGASDAFNQALNGTTPNGGFFDHTKPADTPQTLVSEWKKLKETGSAWDNTVIRLFPDQAPVWGYLASDAATITTTGPTAAADFVKEMNVVSAFSERYKQETTSMPMAGICVDLQGTTYAVNVTPPPPTPPTSGGTGINVGFRDIFIALNNSSQDETLTQWAITGINPVGLPGLDETKEALNKFSGHGGKVLYEWYDTGQPIINPGDGGQTGEQIGIELQNSSCCGPKCTSCGIKTNGYEDKKGYVALLSLAHKNLPGAFGGENNVPANAGQLKGAIDYLKGNSTPVNEIWFWIPTAAAQAGAWIGGSND